MWKKETQSVDYKQIMYSAVPRENILLNEFEMMSSLQAKLHSFLVLILDFRTEWTD